MIDAHEAKLEQLRRQKERRQDRRVDVLEERNEMRDEVNRLRDDIRDLKTQIFKQGGNARCGRGHAYGGRDPLIRAKAFDW